MDYKNLNDESVQFLLRSMKVWKMMEHLDQGTIDHLLIKFDESLNWITANGEHVSGLDKRQLLASFLSFFYGFYSGVDYCPIVDDFSINNIKTGGVK